MGYLIRLLTTSPLSSLVPVQAQLFQRGYRVTPAGTNQLDVWYDANFSPLTVELTDSNHATTRQEIMQFIEWVSRQSGEPAQGQVLDVLARTQAVLAIGVPDDYDNTNDALNEIIDIVANAAEGLFQVDGEGFYDGNQLILPMS
jgi:hypothetical protein